MRRPKSAIFILFISTLLICSFEGRARSQEFVEPFSSGDIVNLAPQKELRGGAVDIKSYRGKKVVVLAFWINSCELCLDQIKAVDDFIKKNNRSKTVILITSVRANESEQELISEALSERKLLLPVIMDSNLFVARKFAATSAPNFFLIDKNGRLAARQIIFADKPVRNMSLLSMIDALRTGKRIPPIQFMPMTNDLRLKEMIGTKAPQFQIGSINGKSFSLEEYRNKMNVVLLFWHSYSPESKTIIRILNDFYTPEIRKKYNYVILAASSIYGQSQMDESRKLQNETQAGFSFLDDVDSAVGKLYNVKSVPTIFVIGKDGRIEDVFTNELGYVTIEKRLDAVFDSIETKSKPLPSKSKR
ncbi:MAG: redoxin domain-containing protein [bacterium]